MSVAKKIVFLDRDGVINKHRPDYVKSLLEFELLPNIGKNLSKLNKSNFKLIVITNQSAVNRGLISIQELEKIHKYMKIKLAEENCIIDAIYYCPHLPEENCLCRKPKTGLLRRAVRDFPNIDLKRSWIIGDSEADIGAGDVFGINTYQVHTNDDISSAVQYILSNKK